MSLTLQAPSRNHLAIIPRLQRPPRARSRILFDYQGGVIRPQGCLGNVDQESKHCPCKAGRDPARSGGLGIDVGIESRNDDRSSSYHLQSAYHPARYRVSYNLCRPVTTATWVASASPSETFPPPPSSDRAANGSSPSLVGPVRALSQLLMTPSRLPLPQPAAWIAPSSLPRPVYRPSPPHALKVPRPMPCRRLVWIRLLTSESWWKRQTPALPRHR